jgi:hypothetical protein
MNVFISHAPKDRAIARQLARLLAKADAGFRVWDPDEEIDPGDNWAKKVGKALQDAELMVVLLTPKAMDSGWIRNDIQFGLASKKFEGRFFSVLVGPTMESPKDVPWILLTLPHIQIESKSHLSEAVAKIKNLALAAAK